MLKKMINWIATLILIVGGLNWGIVGVFDYDLLAGILSDAIVTLRSIYTVVGLAAVYMSYVLYQDITTSKPPL